MMYNIILYSYGIICINSGVATCGCRLLFKAGTAHLEQQQLPGIFYA